jgi:hypothetical protein
MYRCREQLAQESDREDGLESFQTLPMNVIDYVSLF